jgi:hypothetical protein
VPEHVLRSADPHACNTSQVPQAPGRSVPVHPGSAAIEQHWTGGSAVHRAVDGPSDGGRQRHEHDLGALAADAQYPVAMLLAQVADVGAGGLEDPQPKQAEHRHQREVVRVRRLAGGGQHGLELQVGEPECRGLRRHSRPADMLSRGMLEHAIDDGGAVEARRNREPPRHRRGPEPAHFLHPADIQLQVDPASGQRVEAALGAPRQEAP